MNRVANAFTCDLHSSVLYKYYFLVKVFATSTFYSYPTFSKEKTRAVEYQVSSAVALVGEIPYQYKSCLFGLNFGRKSPTPLCKAL
jgi:hypothetical protein